MTAVSTFTINATLSSREIAQLTGKEHRHVLRDCDSLNENYDNLGLPKIGQGSYTTKFTGNQQHREMLLTKIQTMDLMTGYNVELRIKVNRRWEDLENSQTKSLDFTNPDTVLQLAQNWADERRKREEVEGELRIAAPKALFADAVATSTDSILIAELARFIKQNGKDIGQNRLFEWLRQNGYLCQKGELYNQPTQKAMNLSLFEVKKTSISKPDGTVLVTATTKVTGKGQQYFINKFINK